MSGEAIALHDRLEIGDNVVFRELEGETVLLNLETGKYFGLDKVGTSMWMLIQEHKALDVVFERMMSAYDAEPDLLQADLLRLAADLAAHGLVRASGAGHDPRP